MFIARIHKEFQTKYKLNVEMDRKLEQAHNKRGYPNSK